MSIFLDIESVMQSSVFHSASAFHYGKHWHYSADKQGNVNRNVFDLYSLDIKNLK